MRWRAAEVAIYLTGDTHNTYDIDKVVEFDASGLTRDDYLIILGDFGFIWTPPCDPGTVPPEVYEAWREDERWLDWFEDRPFTTLWVDGNHENFDLLEGYPVQEWHGGRVQPIREHVLHLMRGEVFDIDGCTFLAMGGAHSTDRHRRTIHESWWPQEVPSEEERARAEARLEECGWRVDYVLTHAAPSPAIREIDPDWPYILKPDEYTDWLQSIAARLDFGRWFHGHYHVDRWWDTTYTGLYNEIFDLDDTGRTPYGSSTDMFEVD